ncbi:CvpA family protein [Papillibacter cinnamivorans]|uniref:CvpA family protein n=1 Tax=Papillibacter cinnamivorans DSM 12816 TaxID=1122930 RepID=A0A1W1ZZ52_9FIRM|nr:CvpA family protein [Papillibacter cinnamivorans]SMC53663.1 hypothetical protein SAMN02745168_1339 [Papillibacter cinnamivorans DSM 12816]
MFSQANGFHFGFGKRDSARPTREQKPAGGPAASVKRTLINLLVTVVIGAVYFYVNLPPLNLHSVDFYGFIFLLCVIYTVSALLTSGFQTGGGFREYGAFVKQQCMVPLVVVVALILVFIVGTVISVPLFRAGSYKDLISVAQGDFTEDVKEISYDKIPMLDKDSAEKLGDRKMGELSDMVSQFEVADNYTQINYKNRPVRVTPLVYGDIIKWWNNRSEGIPAYLIIDMVTQGVEVVRLQDGIKYTTAEHFSRNLYRYLRFRYPTYMFDAPVFEINDDGEPYWICPRVEKTIGLFGGTDIFGAVLVNAVTGESVYYPKEEVPAWVDRVYTAELIIEQYDYYGLYRNGFFNSIFGQRGVTVTTDGYNYIAMNDDVYVYTGITSVTGDQSNIGFILSNQRTKQTTYYSIPGAEEYSAMSSAEGVVQHLNYVATFPLLLNISNQPTYFMALKDNAGLVKMYAMVNVRQYQIVGTGQSVAECERDYVSLLVENNVTQEESLPQNTVTGTVAEIRTAVKDGNSYYYIRLDGKSEYYVISAEESEAAVILNVGDSVQIEYDGQATGELRNAYSITRLDAGVSQPAPSASPAPLETPSPSVTPAPEVSPAAAA